MEEQYEHKYEFIEFTELWKFSKTTDLLNENGRAGWQLVSTVRDNHLLALFFKRRINNDQ